MDIHRWRTQARKGWLETFILLVLRNEDSYGYAIAANVQELLGDALPEGTLYPLLKRLERDGLVTTRWDTNTGGAPRKYYSITKLGRTMCTEMLQLWRHWKTAISPWEEQS